MGTQGGAEQPRVPAGLQVLRDMAPAKGRGRRVCCEGAFGAADGRACSAREHAFHSTPDTPAWECIWLRKRPLTPPAFITLCCKPIGDAHRALQRIPERGQVSWDAWLCCHPAHAPCAILAVCGCPHGLQTSPANFSPNALKCFPWQGQ